MSKPSMKIQKEPLKVALHFLSDIYPLSDTIRLTLHKDFHNISQMEALEILRYLVSICSNDKKFKPSNQKSAKNFTMDPKIIIQNFKKDLISSIKELSLQGKVNIPVLKNSHLLLPYNPAFFNCCLGLCSYALSLQLSLRGINFWSGKLNMQDREAILGKIYEDFTSYEKIVEDSKIYLKELEFSTRQLQGNKQSGLQVLENFVNFIHQSSAWCCDDLDDALKRKEEFSCYSANAVKIIKDINENLESIKKIEVAVMPSSPIKSTENVSNAGFDLKTLIPNETQLIMEKQGIPVLTNGLLNLEGLVEILQKQSTTGLGDNNNLQYLFLKVERIKKSIMTEIHDLQSQLVAGHEYNRDEVLSWLTTTFPPIPALNFITPKVSNCRTPEAVISMEAIDRIIKIKSRNKCKNACGATEDQTMKDIDSRRKSVTARSHILKRRSRSSDHSKEKGLTRSHLISHINKSSHNADTMRISSASALDLSFGSPPIQSSTYYNMNSDGTFFRPPEVIFEGEKSLSPIQPGSVKHYDEVLRRDWSSSFVPVRLNISELTEAFSTESSPRASLNYYETSTAGDTTSGTWELSSTHNIPSFISLSEEES